MLSQTTASRAETNTSQFCSHIARTNSTLFSSPPPQNHFQNLATSISWNRLNKGHAAVQALIACQAQPRIFKHLFFRYFGAGAPDHIRPWQFPLLPITVPAGNTNDGSINDGRMTEQHGFELRRHDLEAADFYQFLLCVSPLSSPLS